MKVVAGILLGAAGVSALDLDPNAGWWDGTGLTVDPTKGCVACHRGKAENTFHCFGAGQCENAFGGYSGAYAACNDDGLELCAACFPDKGAPCADPAKIESVKVCSELCYAAGAGDCYKKSMCPYLSKGKYALPEGGVTDDAGLTKALAGCTEAIGCASCYSFLYGFDRSLTCAQCDISVLTFDLITGNTDEESKAACQALMDKPSLEGSCKCLTGISKLIASQALNCMVDMTHYGTLMAQRDRCNAEPSAKGAVVTSTISFASAPSDAELETARSTACADYYAKCVGNGAGFGYDEITCTLAAATARRLLAGVDYVFTVTALTTGVDEFFDDVRESNLKEMNEALGGVIASAVPAIETLPPTAPPTTVVAPAAGFSGAETAVVSLATGVMLVAAAMH